MTDKAQKILSKIELLLNETNYEPYSDEVLGRIKSLKELKSYIDSLQEEPVNDKLHEFEKEFFSIVNPYRNSHNYKNICVNLINWQHNLWRWLYWKENKKEPVSEELEKAHIWKPADGDDLPEIDREVIALLDNGKVGFAHRPPEYWDGKDIVTGKVTRNYPKTYDKGGWNIPDVKYWLDVELPKEIEL